MSEQWRRCTLGEVVELKRGYDLPTVDRRAGAVPIISSSGPSGWHDEARVKAPGVVTGRYGTIGDVFFVEQDFWPLNTTLYVRDFKGNDERFVSYFLRSLDFQSFNDKSSVPGLNRNDLHRAPVLFPSFDEQREIAAVLGSLDDKIGQNRRTGRALERLARATFKAWFVDFEPVKAKAAGAAGFPSMPPAAFAALPDRLTDSSIGPVPQGWGVRPLSAICEIVNGGTPKRSMAEFWDGDVPWYSVRDAPPEGMPWVDSTDEQITRAGLDGSAATLVPVGCTIVSARGTVGRLALVARPMAFNQSCYGLLPIDNASYRHLYLLLRHVVAELQQWTHGSVFDTITRDTFDRVNVVYPAPGFPQQFEISVAPLFDLLSGLLKESSKLGELRDYLLPRLLSGTVQVEARNG